MGYTTEFEGAIWIEPPLEGWQIEEINRFCGERHDGDDSILPGIWCDWQTDGEWIRWNGAEKAYSMVQWLDELIGRFFRPWGRALDGRMLAQGENRSDRWILACRANAVSREDFSIHQLLGITGPGLPPRRP